MLKNDEDRERYVQKLKKDGMWEERSKSNSEKEEKKLNKNLAEIRKR